MSILTCPVCQGAMREVNREGILIDVCTQCRGVWLDRGELEKLAAFMPAPVDLRRPMRGAPPEPYREDYPYREERRGRDDDDDDARYDGDRRYRGDSDRRYRDDDDRRYRGGDDRGGQRSGIGRFLDLFD